MDLSLIGRHALVCGGSKGIGFATAVELALLGASVTLLARNESALREAIGKLDVSAGQEHRFLVADASDPTALGQLVATYATLNPLHILINNSGGPAAGPANKADISEFSAAFTQHLLANHALVQAVLPSMKTAGFGRIVNIISTSVKQPLENLGVSNTIRGAVASWAKTLANELGIFGITVNNVLPGATATERLTQIITGAAARTGKTIEEASQHMAAEIPMRRFAEPAEVGAAAAFLCSPAAAYINGINLPVDGGRTKSL